MSWLYIASSLITRVPKIMSNHCDDQYTRKQTDQFHFWWFFLILIGAYDYFVSLSIFPINAFVTLLILFHGINQLIF